ncbi:zinc finger bed domain-containing protein 1-like protein [Lasius niger]|uniref:Zinc finger bed domain-containing protein 1-like protein n=1 Tax=Lasius niger TaxID=67767 RepID=A0A0J7KHK9_LASNI|nr:zinc finger bed domain-containing protein 1-like protein [Lasius niger]
MSQAAASIPLFSQAIIHLNSYLEEPILAEDEDVIKFWISYIKCDALREIALKYLSVPTTSKPSKRVHSIAKNTITDDVLD